MTRLFRSKSCGGGWSTGTMFHFPVTTPFIISPERRYRHRPREESHNHQFPILDILAAVLRKSLVTCSVEREDVASSMDIGWPTDVRHVSHVTFDRFNGFLGLPVELEPELLRKVPSASVRVFGVSANSMQCSHDQRGNSVPTILLMMQKRLYSEGGLQAEGIFRINAENSQEEYVRNQLNKGVVPHGIDVHCLAGLIKAWFRELPAGVLDCLTPEQVMHCNTEDECTQLLKLLPLAEAALLDWAINLMADVVQASHEIAKVAFGSVGKQSFDQILFPWGSAKTCLLIVGLFAIYVIYDISPDFDKQGKKTKKKRDLCGCNSSRMWLSLFVVINMAIISLANASHKEKKSASQPRLPPSCSDSPRNKGDPHSSNPRRVLSRGQTFDGRSGEGPAVCKLFRSVTIDRFGSDSMEKFWSFPSENDAEEGSESVSDESSTMMGKRENSENGLRGQCDDGEVEGIFDRLGLKKGVRKLCRHPVFQLSKPVKKSGLEALGL
ncbi:Rho GTPase activating protein with PAK-box/P21-Rho-binding domain-containing protein [Actinidia rufa]|uniref:Rho GTPase activating protein with PAK-box/P21-Rho-binding domain-containing protein n=1 Tax=Actinidia rufa TaxID=165716 RepID=A0A7J0F4B9_9ERIC|nr:Rho GTPase activating protein with PAK-box/P21-Rho-binding domain-containing protein [Actinidia rufa]